jgi:hypothetical protein
MVVNAAGQDGVCVGSAGNPSANTASTASNGLEVVGAQGDRLFVGPADMHGVPVNPAGYHGVEVTYAGTYGVRVFSAGIVGVYANTTQANGEWGIDTPDKIYAGTALASNGPLMLVAQSGDGGSLETGDLVIVSGTGTRLGESESPMPLVRRVATSDRSVMGVVYRHLVAEEKVEEIERDGEVERQTRLGTRSAEGPAMGGAAAADPHRRGHGRQRGRASDRGGYGAGARWPGLDNGQPAVS